MPPDLLREREASGSGWGRFSIDPRVVERLRAACAVDRSFFLGVSSRLRLDEQDLRPLNPPLPQVHPEPAVAVLRVEADGGSRPELGQVVLRPGLAQIRRKRDA